MQTPAPIQVIGAPQDLGQARRGVDMGPSAIRVAGLAARLETLGYEVVDAGDVPCGNMSTAALADPKLRFVDEVVRDVEALADAVEKAVRAGHFPLVLGGDNSISIGTLAGLARVEPLQGIIWVDAHADFNTPETSPSGNIHGMPVAAILGYGDRRLVEAGGVSPKALDANTVMIGLRDVDPGEAERLRRSSIRFFTMREVDERGMRDVAREAVEVVAAGGVNHVHLCFDMDAIDPRHAPGTGTPVPGGLTYRESHLLMEVLHDTRIVTSAEVVEVNPVLDVRNQTAAMAVDLIASLFGESVL